jgi:hypothetical protein
MPWAALEVLACRARTVDGALVAEIGVRALAVELGVAKDTAARALVVLRTHGVLVVDQRRTALGKFGPASYTIVTGSGVFGVDHAPRRRAIRTTRFVIADRQPRSCRSFRRTDVVLLASTPATSRMIYRQVPVGGGR